MPRLCTVCAHPKSQQIDFDLLRHVSSYRRLAHRYGLQSDAILRHERKHLSWTFAKSKELQAMLDAQNLLTKLGEWHSRMEQQYANADANGEIATTATVARVALQAIDQFHKIALDTDIERKIADIEQRLAAMNGGTPPTP